MSLAENLRMAEESCCTTAPINISATLQAHAAPLLAADYMAPPDEDEDQIRIGSDIVSSSAALRPRKRRGRRRENAAAAAAGGLVRSADSAAAAAAAAGSAGWTLGSLFSWAPWRASVPHVRRVPPADHPNVAIITAVRGLLAVAEAVAKTLDSECQ